MLTKNISLIRDCREILAGLFLRNIDAYVDLFFHEEEVKLDKEAINLYKAGILRKGKNKKWLANVMVFPFHGKFIVTDFLFSKYKKRGKIFIRKTDDVWPMYPHETLNFVNKLIKDSPTKPSSKILDLASGSGAIGLLLADKFNNIFSADISPKAIAYAKFNSVLNNLEDKITNLKSDIFSSLKGLKFNYIVWNGPTGAFPDVADPNKYYPYYIYGGSDGTKFTKRFLNEALDFVTGDFRIKFLDCSLGDDKKSLAEKYIREKLGRIPIQVNINYLNIGGGLRLQRYADMYDKYCTNKLPMNLIGTKEYSIAVKKWEVELRERHLDKVYFSYISIKPSKKFRIVHKYPTKSTFLPRHNFGFEWHYASKNFIRRYLDKHARISPKKASQSL
jgi:hypothetical protein